MEWDEVDVGSGRVWRVKGGSELGMNTVHTHWSRTGGMEHSSLQKQAERHNQSHDSDKNVQSEN